MSVGRPCPFPLLLSRFIQAQCQPALVRTGRLGAPSTTSSSSSQLVAPVRRPRPRGERQCAETHSITPASSSRSRRLRFSLAVVILACWRARARVRRSASSGATVTGGTSRNCSTAYPKPANAPKRAGASRRQPIDAEGSLRARWGGSGVGAAFVSGIPRPPVLLRPWPTVALCQRAASPARLSPRCGDRRLAAVAGSLAAARHRQ